MGVVECNIFTYSGIFSVLHGSVGGKSGTILIFLIVHTNSNECSYTRLLILVWINGGTVVTPQLLTNAPHND
jgi:hypothetical protein